MAIMKRALQKARQLASARKRAMRIRQRIDTVYPAPERMNLRTYITMFLWRNRARLAVFKTRKRIYTADYLNFYRWVTLKTAEKFLETHAQRPVVILIGGIAGSGKSTIAERFAYIFSDVLHLNPTVVSLDGYFKERVKIPIKNEKGEVIRTVSKIAGKKIPGEFDNPRASNLKQAIEDIRAARSGKPVIFRSLDIDTNKPVSVAFDPSKSQVLIVEGLYTLNESFAKLGDIRIGIIASLKQQADTRISRDIMRMHKDAIEVMRKFVSRERLQRDFVTSGIPNADIVLDITRKPLGGSELELWVTAPRGAYKYDEFLRRLALGQSEILEEHKKLLKKQQGQAQ